MNQYRFKIVQVENRGEDNETGSWTVTPWADELVPYGTNATAPAEVGKVQQAHPNAEIQVERRPKP